MYLPCDYYDKSCRERYPVFRIRRPGLDRGAMKKF